MGEEVEGIGSPFTPKRKEFADVVATSLDGADISAKAEILAHSKKLGLTEFTPSPEDVKNMRNRLAEYRCGFSNPRGFTILAANMLELKLLTPENAGKDRLPSLRDFLK